MDLPATGGVPVALHVLRLDQQLCVAFSTTFTFQRARDAATVLPLLLVPVSANPLSLRLLAEAIGIAYCGVLLVETFNPGSPALYLGVAAIVLYIFYFIGNI